MTRGGIDAEEHDPTWTLQDLRRGDFALLYNGLAEEQVNVGKLGCVGEEHFIGRVEAIKWDVTMDPDKSTVRIRWMYRPHDIPPELLPANIDMADNELLLSNHLDTNLVSTVIGRCNVCPYKQLKEVRDTAKALYFWRLCFDAKGGKVKVDRNALGYDGKEFQWVTQQTRAKGKKSNSQKRKRVRADMEEKLQELPKAAVKENQHSETFHPSEAGGSRIDNDHQAQQMATSEKQEETYVDVSGLGQGMASVKSGEQFVTRRGNTSKDEGHEQADSLRDLSKEATPDTGYAGNHTSTRRSKVRDQPPLSASDVPAGSGLDILTEAAAREESSERERDLEFSEGPSRRSQPQGIVLGVSDLPRFSTIPAPQQRQTLLDEKAKSEDQEHASRILEKLPSLWLQDLIDADSMSKLKMLIQHDPEQFRPIFHALGLRGQKGISDSSFATFLNDCLQKAAANALNVAASSKGFRGDNVCPPPSSLQLEATWGDKFLVSAWIGGLMYRGTLQLTPLAKGSRPVPHLSTLRGRRDTVPIPDMNAPPPATS